MRKFTGKERVRRCGPCFGVTGGLPQAALNLIWLLVALVCPHIIAARPGRAARNLPVFCVRSVQLWPARSWTHRCAI